jgi:hypothetical protein
VLSVTLRPMVGLIVTSLALLGSCSRDGDPDPDQTPDPNPNPNTGTVSISSADNGVFWGDVMTINGSGFSATKSENIVTFKSITPSCTMNYTSENGDIELISATASKLEVRVPYRLNPFGEVACGPEKADIQVKVGDNTATVSNVTFGALPQIGKFVYHYGGFADPKYHPLGDSVILTGRLGSNTTASPNYSKLRLSVAGVTVPFKWRSVNLNTGLAFVLPIEQFSVMDCPLGEDNYSNARKVKFRLFLEGTNKFAETDLYIQKIPNPTANCFDCPTKVKKSLGENLVWTIKGKYMTYSKVRFSPQTPANCGTTQHVSTSGSSEELKFTIPISILSIGCAYNVSLIDHCENALFIGSIVVE